MKLETAVHLIIGIACLVGIIFATYTAVFAAPIDPDGVGDHEYTDILITATDEDIDALECVVYHEAGHCTDWRVRLAVVETVLNRCISADFPDSIEKVCKQKNQFAYRQIPKSAPDWAVEGVSDAIEHVVHEGRTVLPDTDYVYFAVGKQKEAQDHIEVGDGKRKYQHMWFGRAAK